MVEEGGDKLVIDPGTFSTSFNNYEDVTAVVVTHVHGDHFDPEKLNQIIASSPNVKIYTTGDVAKEFGEDKVKVVTGGDKAKASSFNLSFYGGNHELYEGFQNVAVLVNGKLLHPGDSYTIPDDGSEVTVLAAPASAPWLRVTEASKYIKDCHAKQVFPIHNSLLSEIGESIHYRILSEAAAEVGSEWTVLKPGESMVI